MQITLENGKRYQATVRASFGSPVAISLLLTRLKLGGFDEINVEAGRGTVSVSARYVGKTMSIDLNYDIERIRKVG